MEEEREKDYEDCEKAGGNVDARYPYAAFRDKEHKRGEAHCPNPTKVYVVCALCDRGRGGYQHQHGINQNPRQLLCLVVT